MAQRSLFFPLSDKIMTIVQTSDIQKTCIAPVNIAVIKYWGKTDTERILPTNSSLSVTLDTADLHSRTTVHASSAFSEDAFWLNGKPESLTKRMKSVLTELRAQREQLEREDSSQQKGVYTWKLHIASVNNFPTAAGLASSASGLACLVVTIAKVYSLLPEGDMDQWSKISKMARMGSGSACRSVFGGFVKWEMGQQADGNDSLAIQVAPKSHWPEMRAIILVANDAKKAVSSTSGMQTTVETSTLFQHRIKHVVPERMRLMEQAIRERNFTVFADVTMQDSNQFHSVCLDTYPPIFYLNDTSKQIIQFVHLLNQHMGKTVVAYTFDAGPNAVLYVLESDVDLVLRALVPLMKDVRPPAHPYVNQVFGMGASEAGVEIAKSMNSFGADSIKRIIYTGVGDGPKEVTDSLLDASGQPLL